MRGGGAFEGFSCSCKEYVAQFKFTLPRARQELVQVPKRFEIPLQLQVHSCQMSKAHATWQRDDVGIAAGFKLAAMAKM